MRYRTAMTTTSRSALRSRLVPSAFGVAVRARLAFEPRTPCGGAERRLCARIVLAPASIKPMVSGERALQQAISDTSPTHWLLALPAN
jgi:hypothetical protein